MNRISEKLFLDDLVSIGLLANHHLGNYCGISKVLRRGDEKRARGEPGSGHSWMKCKSHEIFDRAVLMSGENHSTSLGKRNEDKFVDY